MSDRERHRQACDPATRDFDYGVLDVPFEVVQQARADIAAKIRAVASTSTSVPAVQRAYELAAQLAEGAPADSADEQPPRGPLRY